METLCEKKIREKLTGEKLQGGLQQPPLGCIRVKRHIRHALYERGAAMFKDTNSAAFSAGVWA